MVYCGKGFAEDGSVVGGSDYIDSRMGKLDLGDDVEGVEYGVTCAETKGCIGNDWH